MLAEWSGWFPDRITSIDSRNAPDGCRVQTDAGLKLYICFPAFSARLSIRRKIVADATGSGRRARSSFQRPLGRFVFPYKARRLRRVTGGRESPQIRSSI